MRGRKFVSAVAAVCAVAGLFVATGGTALAADAPGWQVTTNSYPTNLVPGQKAQFAVSVFNIGGAQSSPGAIVTDTLPEGVEAVTGHGGNYNERKPESWTCSTGKPIVCTTEVISNERSTEGNVVNTLLSGEEEQLLLPVTVSAGLAEGAVTNKVTVSGGGAAETASTAEEFTVSSKPAGFGIADAQAWASNADGTIDTRAGSHPFAFTFAFNMNSNARHTPEGEVRNLEVNLPPGLVGNAAAVPRCTREEFDEERCPTGSQIGVAPTDLGGFGSTTFRLIFAVYNMVPPPGHPAEFAFELFNNQVFLDASVRSDGDYGITEHATNIPQREVTASAVEIWGAPANSAHNPLRTCREEGKSSQTGCGDPEGQVPLLTLPTSCKGPEEYSALATEWLTGATAGLTLVSRDQQDAPIGLAGCEDLQFEPAISVAPDTSNSDTPAGLTVELKVPQEGLLATEGVATSNIQDTTVTLPEGVAINPGQAAGLVACQEAESGIGTQNAPTCPAASKVGTDEIETPLLRNTMRGNVYILESNPPNLKLLVAVSGEGVNLKLVGHVHLDATTGRLVTTFENTPELPFTTFRLSFNGGAQAALTTPLRCGGYMTTSDFTPWSAPLTLDAFPESEFLVDSGPDGSGCLTGTLPFSPELTAGSTTDQAGGFTGFSMLLKRGDGQQRIERLQFKAPQGLSGMLSSVPLCEEPQAAAGTCSAASQIGHSVVSSGPGPYPLVIPQPGQPESPIYLTGPYDGAPFGLAIVTHVIAGPFNLGTIVTRAKIEVDPATAQIIVTTDPLPQVLDGVPTDIRLVDAVIDRKGFMFNPTSCEPMSFSGTAWGAVAPGAGGASSTAPISSRFQVGSCGELPFKPKFTALIHKRHSRKQGAYLHVVMKSSSGQADIKEVHVKLPRALPSRLSTLQQACTEQQFAASPAGCPEGSVVGQATIYTPVLPVPLKGPAYFVSHGGAKYPELVLVVQGDGVTIQLNGETSIKNGITSSTFKSVPDQPFTRFDLVLPTGPHSALSMTTNPCKHALTMPTRIVAQSGKVIEKSTKLMVAGCGKAKKSKSARHAKHHYGHHSKGHAGKTQGRSSSKGKGKH